MPRHKQENPQKASSALFEGFLLGKDEGKGRFETEVSHVRLAQKTQTSTKLPHFVSGFLSVHEAATMLQKSKMTITRWCETGKLPSVPKTFGERTTYLIAPQAVELLLLQQERRKEKSKAEASPSKPIIKPHSAYIDGWVTAMAQGTLNGRAFSLHTIEAYQYRMSNFLKLYPVVNVEALERALLAVPVESFAIREKLYKAVICFAKFLQRQGALSDDFQKQAKPLAPKAHKPPKRHTVTNEGLTDLFSACESSLEWAIVHLLAHTGLRASELCVLTLADIDLDKASLTVERGKGGKQRRIGLSKVALDAVCLFLAKCPPTSASAPLFLNCHGLPMNRYNLYQLLQRIGDRVRVKVSPHALRRAFVTINANKGRPLQMLQIACGHSKITTTMSYCRTSEQEVIDAMKEWD
jgi:integrase